MNRQAVASQDDVRRHNLGRLLRLLHVRGAMSRARLTALTGLNRSTVGALTGDLVDAGLVRETTPVGRGRAGRPSIVVEPESARTFALAIDLGVEHVIAARIGLGGGGFDRREIRPREGQHDPAQTVASIHRLLESMLASAPKYSTCVGVGVGIAGVVGVDDNVVRFAPNLRWVDVPLGSMLAERLDGRLPVVVGNDGSVGALAEHVRG